MVPEKIWIDTDIIFNKPGKEVDDGLALMMAFNSPAVEIEGISLIHQVDNGYEVTQKLIEFYSDDKIPVVKGTDNARQSFGINTEAVEKLANALEKEPLTIVAIGPATNIANLLEFYPEAAENISEIVFCAGRNPGVSFRPRGSTRSFPDYNFDMDPQSFIRVLESDLPIVFSGYEASESIFLYEDDLWQIKENGRPGDEWVHQMLQPWLNRWKRDFNVDGFIPFDTCTIGHVMYPDFFHYHQNIPVKINRRPNDCGAVIDRYEKQYLEVSYDFSSPYIVDFVYKTEPSYKTQVMHDLLGH